jgi:hypothetical protein
MKQSLLRFIMAGIISGGLACALQAQEQEANPTPAAQAASPTAAAQPDKVAFTFQDDEQMRQFAQLWGKRQGILTRTAVLQAYWNEEEALLAEVNQQLLSQFNLDVTKAYALDAERKALIEQPAAPQSPQEGGSPQAP